MKITLGIILALLGVVMLLLGISGIAGWETNIGLDAVGAALLFFGVVLSFKASGYGISVG